MIGDYGFDANGNWLGTGSQSNTWNVENQLISNGTVDYGGNPLTYTYDPWGKRVLQYSVGGVYGPTGTIYFYSITGQRLATYTGQYPNELTQTSVNMYFGGRLLAPVDRLGSVRYNQNGPIAYFPWGEERPQNGQTTPDGTDKFGTYFRDATNNGIGEDYASARYYNNNFGRFWSPDPAGVKAARTKNPTSWNRYEYANDDPVNMFDPSGLGSGFTGSDPNDPTSGGSGPTTGCTTFADEGGVSTGGWTISACWYTGIGSTDDPSPTGSCSAPSNYVLPGGGGGGGSCGGTGTTNTPPPCPPQYQAYINAYGPDAIAAGLPEANTLALTSIESQWGTGNFAKYGNDFFNLEIYQKAGLPKPANKFAYQLSWMQASDMITHGPLAGDYAWVATYSSALDSFKSAAARFSNLTAPDPATFAKNAVADGIYAGRSPAFLTREQIFANCLAGQ